MRRIFSECSTIAASLAEPKQPSPTAEALLWIRSVELFLGDQDETWRIAKIIGLVSRSGCHSISHTTLADVMNGRMPVVRDKNNICDLGVAQL
jgi:hypothetical protein